MLGSTDAKEVEHSEELSLRNMLVMSDVVVLEYRFQMNALVFNSNLVFLENLIDSLLILLASKVLSTSKKRISRLDCGNSGCWCLVNASDCESTVHVCNEVSVTEETLGVRGFVLLGQSLKFIIRQSKIHGRENGFELRTCNSTLSQFVEITEELLNSDALHDDGSVEPLLYIGWVI